MEKTHRHTDCKHFVRGHEDLCTEWTIQHHHSVLTKSKGFECKTNSIITRCKLQDVLVQYFSRGTFCIVKTHNHHRHHEDQKQCNSHVNLLGKCTKWAFHRWNSTPQARTRFQSKHKNRRFNSEWKYYPNSDLLVSASFECVSINTHFCLSTENQKKEMRRRRGRMGHIGWMGWSVCVRNLRLHAVLPAFLATCLLSLSTRSFPSLTIRPWHSSCGSKIKTSLPSWAIKSIVSIVSIEAIRAKWRRHFQVEPSNQ